MIDRSGYIREVNPVAAVQLSDSSKVRIIVMGCDNHIIGQIAAVITTRRIGQLEEYKL